MKVLVFLKKLISIYCPCFIAEFHFRILALKIKGMFRNTLLFLLFLLLLSRDEEEEESGKGEAMQKKMSDREKKLFPHREQRLKIDKPEKKKPEYYVYQ